MLHWTWQKTELQPSFTGHNMYSGTGFMTKDGMPAAIYHGGGSRRNQIAIAKDHKLSAWEKPFPVEPKTADGKEAEIKHWDPDCFLITGPTGAGKSYLARGIGRYERRSALVAAQMPVEHWHQCIGDPTLADAILDRLIHNAYTLDLKGESMRKKNSPLTSGGQSDTKTNNT